MNPYKMNGRELYAYLYRRFIILLSKLMSRKAVIFIISTLLLTGGVIDQNVWQFITAAIILDVGGQNIARYFRDKEI